MSNLLPPEQKKIVRREYKLRVLCIFLILTFVAECFGVVFLIPAYIYSDTKRESAEADKASAAKPEDKDLQVFATLRLLGNQARASQPESRQPFSDAIKLVLAHAGNGISLQSIVVENKGPQNHSLSVGGRASSRQTLLAFKNSMQAEKGISGVDIPVSAFAQDQNISFTAKIDVVYLAPGQTGEGINSGLLLP